jgi:hypothetical protein
MLNDANCLDWLKEPYHLEGSTMRKAVSIVILVCVLWTVACSAEPETVIETVIHESTVEVPQTVEVTRQVEVTVEVTRQVEVTQEVEVEVTRIMEVVITATLEPTPEPTATNTPAPVVSKQPVVTPAPEADIETRLLDAMISLRNKLQGFGGYIDAALRGSPFSCEEILARHDTILNTPTFDMSGASFDVQSDYGSFRAAVDLFANGTRDMIENCRQAINNQTSTTIPPIQWTLARSEVDTAISTLNHPIGRHEGQ